MPPIVQITKSISPKVKMSIGLAVRNFSACMVAPTEMPRKMVTIFISEPCAEPASLSTTPLSRIKFPSINIPIKGVTAGIRMAVMAVTMSGKKIFSRLDTGLNCFMMIFRSCGLVNRLIMGG